MQIVYTMFRKLKFNIVQMTVTKILRPYPVVSGCRLVGVATKFLGMQYFSCMYFLDVEMVLSKF